MAEAGLKAPDQAAVERLFENAGPVLVEVRFPGMATSPDWYLFDDEDQLTHLCQRLGVGAEILLHSVWDLKNARSPIRLQK